MAVTKLWSVTERLGQVIDYATNPEKTSANIKREFSPEQYQALAEVIAYAKDEEKTEREFYVEVNGTVEGIRIQHMIYTLSVKICNTVVGTEEESFVFLKTY